MEVFVAEQNVPSEQERDEYDAQALHFLALADGAALGTARVLLADQGAAKIGRVAILKPARNLGLGAALMRHIEHALDAKSLFLDAQTYAVPFYKKLGYAAYGDQFLEAGITHFHMRKDRR